MTFSSELDRASGALQASSGDTYEIAASVASAADWYEADTSNEAAAVARLRDVFGTWVERIHSNSTSTTEAMAAHRDIALALHDWSQTSDKDITGYAMRWRNTIATIDTGWLDEEGIPLTRGTRFGRFLHRCTDARAPRRGA